MILLHIGYEQFQTTDYATWQCSILFYIELLAEADICMMKLELETTTFTVFPSINILFQNMLYLSIVCDSRNLYISILFTVLHSYTPVVMQHGTVVRKHFCSMQMDRLPCRRNCSIIKHYAKTSSVMQSWL